MYASKRRLGIIDMSSSIVLSAEVPMVLPKSAIAVFSRLKVPQGAVSMAALDEMLAGPDLEFAAEQLADAEVDFIVFACTSGSLLHGVEWDQSLIQRIEKATGIRATTTSTAVVAALRTLGIQRLSIGTPYPKEIDDAERRFFTSCGFDVRTVEGLGLEKDAEVGRLEMEEVRQLALLASHEDSDGLFLSCTNLPTFPLLADLATELGRPVVSSNSATLWYSLYQLGIPPVDGLGKLGGEAGPVQTQRNPEGEPVLNAPRPC